MTIGENSGLQQAGTVSIGPDCIIPSSVRFEDDVQVGPRVIFVESPDQETLVRTGTVIEAAAVIGAGVTIGQGALVRAGAVVLCSVPPNGIVEGNPAQLVGHLHQGQMGSQADIMLRDARSFGDEPRPARLDLGVGDSAMYMMRRIFDARGGLSVGEIADELPFNPARYFLVFDVPSEELRGQHSHKECAEFLICVHGSCRTLLDDGERRVEVTLDRPDLGVYMPPMIWGTQYKYTKDAVLLVFASHPYEDADYLRTYDEFKAERAARLG